MGGDVINFYKEKTKMKITISDNDGNVTGYVEIDNMSDIPEESRAEMITSIIAKNNEYNLAKLANELERQKEISARVKIITDSIVSTAEFAVNEYLPAN